MAPSTECDVDGVNFALALDHAAVVDLTLPSSLVPFAEKQRDSFLAHVSGSSDAEGLPQLPVELLLLLVSHIPRSPDCASRRAFIQALWNHVETKVLGPTTDIHMLAVTQLHGQETRRRKLINSYYSAWSMVGFPKLQRHSALLRAQDSGEAKVHGLLGGQGNNKHYFDEIRAVWETYKPLIHDIVTELSDTLKTLSLDPRVAEQYPKGLDTMEWLTNPKSTPDADYLITAPVSFPLIGLLQVAHMKAICMSLAGTPAEFPAPFHSLAGHSQGVVVAASVSAATDWPSFLAASVKAVTILFWIGSRCQQIFRQDALSDEASRRLESDGHGKASPMLSISNIRQDQIERAVDGLNKHLPSDKHAHVALVNSVSNFVVSGPERTLAALIRSLQVASATDAQSQTRVPFSQRKPLPAIRFLPITIPCHCPLLDEAVPLIESDLGDSCSIQAKSLEIPVSQLQVGSGGNNADLTPFLVRMVTSEPVNWLESDFQGATHIVDFGPGLVNGVGSLTHRNLAGSGARVLVAGKLGSPSGELSFEPSFELGTLEELYSAKEGQVPRAPRWAQDEQVSLIRTSSGTMVSSKLSRLLGLPPVMVAGMTPTTTRPEFVAAVINAGYHVEFAAGGYHDAEWLKSALFRLRDLIPAGRGITLNVLYVAPKALAWQIPLIRQLRADGFPLTGMTVGAGVPSPSVATEYIDTLGLEHISFKPSSAASIRQVVEIARNRPTFPIILQWTGGRGGGHHSAEDMHAPILETYADIRSCPNLILVAGSGFGCAEDVIPYFTGSWSLARGRPYPMPFDGVLLGSRVMTCAEAFTSAGAKEAIAAVSGVEDRDWEGTYRGVAGGIISVVSEMGEPIHVIATRGAQLWAEMDKLVFSLDRKKRGGVLEKYKHYIISRLNADFQRPWFGIRADGTACDVSDMTYDAAARRLLSLMFVNGQRWIDKSHAGLLYRFLLRVEERFRTGDDGDESAAPESISSETDCQDTPTGAIKSVMLACPLATSTLLFHEDVDYFIQLCRRPGQKPVPFIPALDDHFETWFKKDSLWQSEDVDSVVGQDAGRTFILHGPVAARHTCKVDEPVGEVLDGINRGVVDHLMAAVHIAEGFPLPYEETVRRLSIPGPKGATPASSTPDGLIPVTMLKGGQLRLLLAGSSSTPPWRSALFGSRFVSRAHDIVENPVLKVVDSVSADTVELLDDSITFFKTLANGDTQPQVKISRQGREIEILLSTHVTPGNEPISLALKFEYRPEAPYAPIREVTEHRNGRVCAMYRQLWQAQEPTASCEGTFTVDVNRLKAFNRAIGYAKVHRHDRVPMDFGIVACWGPICAALLQDPVQGDVLNLVHLSNAYEVFGEHTPMAIGDVLETKALVRSITIEDSGKVVKIACQLRRAGAHMMTVRSAFLFRGNYTDFPSTFARTVEPRFELDITSETDIALLDTKPWFRLENKNVLDHLNLTELTLEFHLETSTTWLSKSTYATLDTAGVVYIRSEAGDLTRVGIVKHNATNCRDNIVLSYLRRWGRLLDHQQKHPLQGSGVSSSSASEQSCEICVPASNEAYSRASGDFNPIHTSPMFARLVGLPGTITHGMYSSAAVSQIVEKYAAGQNPDRIRRYDVSFTGMVLPGDVLDVSLRHSGMQAGAQVIDITATNTRTGDKALVGSALVSQPPTTVVFAGQGSQEQGMGMQLYASSPVARAVWDRADAYFESQFGLSIVNIVRYNPKEIKVHFGGVRGRMLRQNYLAMSYYEAVHTEGPTSPRLDRRPMFQTITQTSTSFTHSSPNGLLFSTQFAQPALTIMEMAAFKDMESRGIVDPNCHFAGHSLGEYAALASTTGFMSFENLLYTVFSRGMTMQNAVDRDDLGRSAFAMVAVDPSRVNKDFAEPALRALITGIRARTGFFIELVNHNIRNKQYVCAGDLRGLDLLQRVCDDMKNSPHPPNPKDFRTHFIERNVDRYAGKTAQQIQLRRGAATVPLSGVDVPFHSSFLRPRMEAFRRVLQESLEGDRVRAQRLVGKYVPNVTGTPFAISREYFEDVFAVTGSERLREVLDDWGSWRKRIDRERDTGDEVLVSC